MGIARRELQERRALVTPVARLGPTLGSLGVGAVVVVADQLTKWAALEGLTDRAPIHLFWTLQLNLTFNSGIAFSLGTGSGALVVPIALVVVIGVILLGRSLRGRLALLATGLVVGGALGNLCDRLFRHHGGAVVDFIDPQWFPIFNVADAGVTVGAVLLALASILQPKDAPQPGEAHRAPAA